MAGTSVPFRLYPAGSPPVVVTGGVRSLFALWMGGAAAAPGAAPPPPEIIVDTHDGGDHHRRKRKEREALREAIERADRRLRGIADSDNPVVAAAVETAASVIEQARSVPSPFVNPYRGALKGIAQSLAEIARAADAFDEARHAMAVALHVKRLREQIELAHIEDEEEAIALLLLH